MAEEVKLLGLRRSPYSCRVEVALKLKGIPYEMIPQDLANKSPLLVEIEQPYSQEGPRASAQREAGLRVSVILEYIEETWKGIPLLPEDPYERATARFWARFIDEKCLNALGKACFSKGEEQEKGTEELFEQWKTLGSQLTRGQEEETTLDSLTLWRISPHFGLDYPGSSPSRLAERREIPSPMQMDRRV